MKVTVERDVFVPLFGELCKTGRYVDNISPAIHDGFRPLVRGTM